ncbi:MAG: glycosyltransferase [Candidatus Nanoarchaeia archaeon]
MKIAIYHPWLKAKGGAERVILELVQRLKRHHCIIFTNFYLPHKTFPEFRNLDVKVVGPKIPFFGFLARGGLFGLAIGLTKLPNLKSFDVLIISTSGIGEFIVFRNNLIPTICYCHTPLRAAHDFFNYYKNRSLLFKLAVLIYRFFESIAWSKFDLILCNSKTVYERIMRAKLANPRCIKIVNPGVDIFKFKPSKTSQNYFLAPGRIIAYKRFELAIEAFSEFNKIKKNFSLVIAGHPEDKTYLARLQKLAASTPNIKFILSPSDKELIELYQKCYAVLFTAKNEDWGLIPLEAMACGKPVIAVNEGGPLESVINNKTGLLVRAKPESIANAMLKLTSVPNLAKKMGLAARTHALAFDWKRFAAKLEFAILEVKNAKR